MTEPTCISVYVWFKCPYCGLEQPRYFYPKDRWEEHYVTTCDLESGGCEKKLVVSVELQPIVKVFALTEAGAE